MSASLPGARPRVAFVIQRYGEEVNGGAEAHCRLLAERMARHWTVEVLTTCALDYVTWADHYAPGVEELNGVTVRRFRVPEPRDIEGFNRVSETLAGAAHPSLEEQERWMRAQGPWSPALLDFIAASRERYDLFVFLGYLYAQSYFGLPLVADKALFAPLAHDEWTIHLPMWDAVFRVPARVMFNTPEERRFLKRRFPDARLPGPVVGVAVERPRSVDPRRFRAQAGVNDGFLLYVGRIDPSKGCGELFDFFREHAERTGDDRTLVLLGKAVMPVPEHPRIRALGFVSEQAKWDALAACDALVMPSPYESLSMALLEAWSVMRPVVVNGACDVLRSQAERSNGGIAYRDRQEFSAALALLNSGGYANVLGRQGHDFVKRFYSWEFIEGRYLEAAAEVASRVADS